MKILINYNKEEKNYLETIAVLLRNNNLEAVATGEDHGIEGLQRLADRANANAVLLLNDQTLCNITGYKRKANEKDSPLAKWRGSRLNFKTPVIVGPPPKWLFKVPYGKFIWNIDLAKLHRCTDPVVQFNFKVCETEIDYVELVRVADSAILISIDIETNILNHISSIAFSCLIDKNTTRTFVIPFVDFGENHWITDYEYKNAIETMRMVCKNSVPKIMWNGIYDAFYLLMYGAEPNNWLIDAMGFFWSEYAELPKDLAFVTSLYCYDYRYWKNEADLAQHDKDIRRFWNYNARDAWWTLRTFLNHLTSAQSYTITNYRTQFKYCYPAIYCAFEGWLIDNKKQAEVRAENEQRLAAELAKLRTMAASPEFNPASPKQVARFLYDIIGAAPLKNFKGESVRGTDEATLGRLSVQHPIIEKICTSILEYRGIAKEQSTYVNFLQMNNRALYQIDPWGTDTARFSCRQSNLRTITLDNNDKPKIKSYGTQIHNISRDRVKSYYIADDGYILIEPDNSKSEARIVAKVSRCKKLEEALADPERDFYRLLGPLLLGIKYEDVTPEIREKILKRINHASNYMMQEKTFVDTATIPKIMEASRLLGITINSSIAVIEGKQYQTPEQFAKFLLSLYHKPFPEIKEWWKEIKLEIMRHQRLVSPLGWTRHFFGDISKDTAMLRSAVAHYPQNLSVAVLNIGWWKIYKELVLPGKGEFRLKAQIHDSSPAQCKIEKLDFYRKEMHRLLTNPIIIHGQTLTIPVESKVGIVWADIKK